MDKDQERHRPPLPQVTLFPLAPVCVRLMALFAVQYPNVTASFPSTTSTFLTTARASLCFSVLSLIL